MSADFCKYAYFSVRINPKNELITEVIQILASNTSIDR